MDYWIVGLLDYWIVGLLDIRQVRLLRLLRQLDCWILDKLDFLDWWIAGLLDWEAALIPGEKKKIPSSF